jgi:pimeloyl-ACP methyl ester carboxylesterase
MTAGPEQTARVGDLELCWQGFGAEDDPPLLMIMGLGSQMIAWPDGLCELLAERGFRVIRFDNRDAGRSTVLADAPTLEIRAALRGEIEGAAYSLSDMAADAAGLLDALEIEDAHVAGASMGGMIAQALAIEHPRRVLSLASISSTTGDPAVGKPNDAGMKSLTAVAPNDREGYIETTVESLGLLVSPEYSLDEDYAREFAAQAFERGYHPEGTQRHVIAIIASGNRTRRLRELEVPTVVIHGDADPLIDVSGGRATAGAIADARLVIIPGMGHELPPRTWPVIAEAIAANATRAGFPAAATTITSEEQR